jgi:spermidine/putrescine transport system permease protein
MINADIVTGISLLLLFIFINMPRGYLTMLLAHITFNIPYVILAVLPKLTQMDPQTYEAALDMGATPTYAVQKVVLPQIMPGIFTGFLLAFTMSFDDFVISFFTTQGLTQNLSVYIYSMARVGINPMINALSAIMFVIVISLLLVVNLRTMKKYKVSAKRI